MPPKRRKLAKVQGDDDEEEKETPAPAAAARKKPKYHIFELKDDKLQTNTSWASAKEFEKDYDSLITSQHSYVLKKHYTAQLKKLQKKIKEAPKTTPTKPKIKKEKLAMSPEQRARTDKALTSMVADRPLEQVSVPLENHRAFEEGCNHH